MSKLNSWVFREVARRKRERGCSGISLTQDPYTGVLIFRHMHRLAALERGAWGVVTKLGEIVYGNPENIEAADFNANATPYRDRVKFAGGFLIPEELLDDIARNQRVRDDWKPRLLRALDTACDCSLFSPELVLAAQMPVIPEGAMMELRDLWKELRDEIYASQTHA